MSKIKNILVIGAGIAGPAICYWLKKYGYSPTLIEKYESIRKGGQAIDLRGVATDLAKKMGIYNAICEKRTRIECGRFVDAEGNVLHEEKGERSGFRQGDDVEIVRGDLVEILMQMIPEVPCHYNRSISTIQQNDDHVTVDYTDGQTENYDLVIGADGIYSATRRLVFDKSEYQLKSLGAYLSIFSIPNYLHLHQIEVLHEKDQKLLSIINYGEPNIARAGLMFRSSSVLNNARSESEQMQFLRDTYNNFGWEANKVLELMPQTDDFYFDSVTQIKMNSWTKGRVALLGDAGYAASPLSGQGTNLALVGAYILAGELKAADGDYKSAFKRYNELMHPFVEKNQQFGLWVSESFLSPVEISSEVAERRSNNILVVMEEVTKGIDLIEY